MTDKAAISYVTRNHLHGVWDFYAERSVRQDQPDPLAYASGRVEGEAARMRGEPSATQLERSTREKNRNKSRVRARVEHIFCVIKRLWGFSKVRYRGLAKTPRARSRRLRWPISILAEDP